MKKSAYRSGQGKMKFSRLAAYLFLVAVFGFLNVFMSQTISQKSQAGEEDRLNDELQKELVMFTTPVLGEIPEARL